MRVRKLMKKRIEQMHKEGEEEMEYGEKKGEMATREK